MRFVRNINLDRVITPASIVAPMPRLPRRTMIGRRAQTTPHNNRKPFVFSSKVQVVLLDG